MFLGPDGGHYRRSNYARRVFRPASDGRHESASGRPGRLIITDTTAWPGLPVAAWPPADPGVAFTPPTGRGIQPIPAGTPLACWLPLKPGLTPHGLRHSHKTWMAEDGIPEILAEQRLGHEVPGMRGRYAHASDRMRNDLKARPPGPLGGFTARQSGHRPALPGPATRRAADADPGTNPGANQGPGGSE